MVIVNMVIKVKNLKCELSVYVVMVVVLKFVSNLVVNIEESGGNSWFNIAGFMIWLSVVRFCEILRFCY